MSRVVDLLRRDEEASWFALIDAAALPDGRAGLRRRGFANMACLFDGDQEREYWDVAPYLASVPSLAEFPESLGDVLDDLAKAGALTLVAARAGTELVPVKRHLKKFTLMYLPDGGPALCRFYDPRVMRVLWPVLTRMQQQAFLAPLLLVVLPSEGRQESVYLQVGIAPAA